MARIQPRGWLAATMVEQGLFIDSGAEPPPAVWVPGPPPVDPGPAGRCHIPESWDLAPVGANTLTYIPLPSPHTLSRLWAWVRGDSSCSTRRSWGAARESIAATPQTLTAPWDPRSGQADRGPVS